MSDHLRTYVHINIYYSIALKRMYVLKCRLRQEAKVVSPILAAFPVSPNVCSIYLSSGSYIHRDISTLNHIPL